MSPPAASTTIAAIASPPGGGLRGILRISGPRAGPIVKAIWRPAGELDLSRRAVLAGRVDDGRGQQPALLLWMPGPRSFTREDVAELHLPGSPPLLEAALARVLALGAVPAAPGEFTRRAFLSGRIDLTRAEGVLATIAARDEGQRRAARSLLAGGLAARVDRVREGLEDARALVEASLDFDPRETGHVPEEEIAGRAADARARLVEALGWETARAALRGEPRIVLAGPPNAGKSALFNRLAGANGAIVSPLPGTTRDVLSAEVRIEGVACRLLDTAGIDAGAALDPIEREAQAAGSSARESADLLLWVVDSTLGGRAPAPPRSTDVLGAWNKIDLAGSRPAPPAEAPGLPWIPTSAATGEGLESLRRAAARALGLAGSTPSGAPGEGAPVDLELSLGHKSALEEAVAALDRGVRAWRAGEGLEILAEDLRRASEALDRITGATAAEAVLDRIFARFCVGK
jgi:tRNA modification GTPase